MRFNQMFALIDSSTTVAVVQAATKQLAKERAQLIPSHIVKVPETCKVKAIKRGTVRNAPIFFEGYFLAIEDALAEAG